MIKYDRASGNLAVLNHGRVAAHYYIQSESVQTFNEKLFPAMSDSQVLRTIASAQEFLNMKVRQEELNELGDLLSTSCPLKIEGAGLDNSGYGLITGPEDKAFVLIQAYIGKAKVKSFTLISDMNYVAANAGRVARAIFEICLKMNEMTGPALKLLRFAKSIDNQIWWFQTPLRHFEDELNESNFSGIETRMGGRGQDSLATALSLLDMQPKEVGEISRFLKGGSKIQSLVRLLPNIDIECSVQPVTAHVLRFQMTFIPAFEWHGRWHGGAQSFWMWVENGDTGKLYHYENILLSRKTFPDSVKVETLLPAFDPMPNHYVIRVISDFWVGCEVAYPVPLTSLTMPQERTPWTDLLDLTPLPTSAVQEPRYLPLYSKFDTFNPIQTQLFHVLYHTDTPIFLGAPTGSGKTIVAELAVLRMKRLYPKGICVYIAPLKSLARERLKEWRSRLGAAPLKWRILELSGDTSHDRSALERADILICTPEKWDMVSRGWRGVASSLMDTNAANGRDFVKRVKLLVLDEVHLLGEERGAVLEAIVSRTRFISHVLKQEKEDGEHDKGTENTRIIGLSTALENPVDLSNWIGINTTFSKPNGRRGMYNFRSSVRPVPIVAHVQGFSGRHYCPRMATMNKPCYAAIKEHSSIQPALIFVASRRQTRLTALDLISYAAAEEDPRRFLHCSDAKIEAIAESIHDEALQHTISFGIGLHHAGLSSHDREIVETLYLNNDIQVLVATATLAWGVNLPAHLVIVKGTEYYDGKTSRYVDYPLTDVLQMMGRAGRPGFDDKGVAVIMCTEDKKGFYHKFLYTPFPLESRLSDRICENINAEVASGTITSVGEAVGYLNWTFFARRMKSNPSYYGAQSNSDTDIDTALLLIVQQTLEQLKESKCIEYESLEAHDQVSPTPLGVASCSYYLLHQTPQQMLLGVRECRKIIQAERANEDMERQTSQKLIPSRELRDLERSFRLEECSLAWIIYTLCNTHEFDELPVRHNEELLNEELSRSVVWGADTQTLLTGSESYQSPDVYADPHTKAFLLVQAHLGRERLPISDYVNDTKSVMENLPRLLAAMEYIASCDASTAGCLDVLTLFVSTRQYLETRSLPLQDALFQIGLPKVTVHGLRGNTSTDKKNKKPFSNQIQNISQLRSLSRTDALALLQTTSEVDPASYDVERALDRLFSMPNLRVMEAEIVSKVEKFSGKSIGTLNLSVELDRIKGNITPRLDFSMTILLGTCQQHFLLGKTTIRASRWGKWTVRKEISFDWSAATADGDSVLVRLMINEMRGLDKEMCLPLK
jgi:activating signal cointegrator complex subunit 3